MCSSKFQRFLGAVPEGSKGVSGLFQGVSKELHRRSRECQGAYCGFTSGSRVLKFKGVSGAFNMEIPEALGSFMGRSRGLSRRFETFWHIVEAFLNAS